MNDRTVKRLAEGSWALVVGCSIELDRRLEFEIRDDGAGFDPSAVSGSGLTNMRDRLDALGGTLEMRSWPSGGTTVSGRIPVGDEVR